MPVVMATTVRRIKQEMKIRRSQSMIASSKWQFSFLKKKLKNKENVDSII